MISIMLMGSNMINSIKCPLFSMENNNGNWLVYERIIDIDTAWLITLHFQMVCKASQMNIPIVIAFRPDISIQVSSRVNVWN